MNEIDVCRFCNSVILKKASYGDYGNHITYICPSCGIYTISDVFNISSIFDDNQEDFRRKSNIASYLYYHKNDYDSFMNVKRYYISDNKEQLQAFIQFIKKQSSFTGDYILIDQKIIDSFTPKTLNEYEKLLLKDIYKKRNAVTYEVNYTIEEIQSAAFVLREDNWMNNRKQYTRLLDDLAEEGYIKVKDDGSSGIHVIIEITTKGIKKIEEGDTTMEDVNKKIEKQVNVGAGGTYVENLSGDYNTVGNINNSGMNFDELEKLIEKIRIVCNKNEDHQLQPEIIESINDNLNDINSYISQKNENGIIKGLKTIKGLLTSATISIAANILTPEIQAMITSIKNCIGA